MSVDVDYCSFSPSRADKQWKYFVEDFSILRRKHAPFNQYQKDLQQQQDEIDRINKFYQTEIDAIIKKIFDHFDAKGYIIPWIEWSSNLGKDKYGRKKIMENEDKIDYLLVYGCVHPRGSNPDDKNLPYLMLNTDAPELKSLYDAKVVEKDEAIKTLTQSFKNALSNEEEINLNERQIALDEGNDSSYLKYENIYDYNQLILDLKYLDIYYGSIRNEYFENPKTEFLFLNLLVKAYDFEAQQGLPSKNDLIKLYKNILEKNTKELSDNVMKQFVCNNKEAESIIKDFFRSIKPVLKDLSETPDAYFIRYYGGYDQVEPQDVEILLIERAKKHAEEYKGLLKPVI